MKNDIRLHIQDDEGVYHMLDLYDDENMTLVDSIQDVKDIKKIFNVFSRDFKVSASPNNNKIFKHYYNTNIRNGFDGRIKTKALLQVGGVDYRKGYLRMIDSITKNGVVDSYKLVFEGESVLISDILKDDKLEDLDFDDLILDNTNEMRVEGIRDGIYINDTIATDEDGNALYPDVIFAPIFKDAKVVASPFGDWSTSNDSPSTNNDVDIPFSLVKFTGAGESNISSATSGVDIPFLGLDTTITNFPITPNDFQPSVKMSRVLRKINNKYDLGLEDSFINREEIDQMYMLFNNEPKERVTQNVSSAFNSALIEDELEYSIYTTESGDPRGAQSLELTNGNDFGEVEFSSVPPIGTMIFELSRLGAALVVENNDVESNVDAIVKMYFVHPTYGIPINLATRRINGIEDGATYGLDQPMYDWWRGADSNNIRFYNQDSGGAYYLEQLVSRGYTIKIHQSVEFLCENNVDGDLDIRFDYLIETNNIITKQLGASTPIVSSFKLFLGKYAPDIKLIDILTGLFKMFNMTAYIDNDNIIVQELEDYYKSGTSHEVTELVDMSSATMSPSFKFKELSMKFKEGDDVLTKNYNGDYNFGGIKLTNEDLLGENFGERTIKSGKEYKIELPFQRMMFEQLSMCYGADDYGTSGIVFSKFGDYTSSGKFDSKMSTDMVIGNQIDDTLNGVDTKPIIFYGKKVDTSRNFFRKSDSQPNDTENLINNLDGYSTGTYIEHGNSAGINGSLSNGRGMVLTTDNSTPSTNSNGISTIEIYKNTANNDNIGDDNTNKWWNPSSIMASRYRRNGEPMNPFGKFQSISFNNDVRDEYESNYYVEFGGNLGIVRSNDWINGLYQTNYERYLDNAFAKSSRITKLNMNFTEELINKYNLKDTFVIGTNEYNINKINLNLLSGKAQVELINKIQFEEGSFNDSVDIVDAYEAPILAMGLSTNITSSSVDVVANVSDLGNGTIYEYGFYYGFNEGDVAKEVVGTSLTSTGSFNASLTGLIAGSTYYISAYVKVLQNGEVRTNSRVVTLSGGSSSLPTTPSLTGSNIGSLQELITLGLTSTASYSIYSKIGSASTFTLATTIQSITYGSSNTHTRRLSHDSTLDGEWYVKTTNSSGVSSLASNTITYTGIPSGGGGNEENGGIA